MGQILSLVLLYELPDLARVPRGPEVVSEGRLGKGAQESAGTRGGTSGTKIGHAHLQGAFAETAVVCLRHNPAGQKYWARLEKPPDQGKAVTIRAHPRARAVSDRLTRHTALAMDTCLHGAGSSAGAPHASRATPGISLS